ncbi:MAG: Uncharacterised protein [Prochlorococcus marinus str. MIT 9215]|nr:MAG: Uncharacterised protein [Prochlorococcus marinus str. MIT 9215]
MKMLITSGIVTSLEVLNKLSFYNQENKQGSYSQWLLINTVDLQSSLVVS